MGIGSNENPLRGPWGVDRRWVGRKTATWDVGHGLEGGR